MVSRDLESARAGVQQARRDDPPRGQPYFEAAVRRHRQDGQRQALRAERRRLLGGDALDDRGGLCQAAPDRSEDGAHEPYPVHVGQPWHRRPPPRSRASRSSALARPTTSRPVSKSYSATSTPARALSAWSAWRARVSWTAWPTRSIPRSPDWGGKGPSELFFQEYMIDSHKLYDDVQVVYAELPKWVEPPSEERPKGKPLSLSQQLKHLVESGQYADLIGDAPVYFPVNFNALYVALSARRTLGLDDIYTSSNGGTLIDELPEYWAPTLQHTLTWPNGALRLWKELVDAGMIDYSLIAS